MRHAWCLTASCTFTNELGEGESATSLALLPIPLRYMCADVHVHTCEI